MLTVFDVVRGRIPKSWYVQGNNCVYWSWVAGFCQVTGRDPDPGAFTKFLLFKAFLGAQGGPIHSSAVPYILQRLSGSSVGVEVRTHPMFGQEYQIASAPSWRYRWMAKRTDWGQPELAVEKHEEYPAIWCWPGHAEYVLRRPGIFVFMSIRLIGR